MLAPATRASDSHNVPFTARVHQTCTLTWVQEGRPAQKCSPAMQLSREREREICWPPRASLSLFSQHLSIPPLGSRVDEWRWERRRRQSLSDRGPHSTGGPRRAEREEPAADLRSAQLKAASESRRRARSSSAHHTAAAVAGFALFMPTRVCWRERRCC